MMTMYDVIVYDVIVQPTTSWPNLMNNIIHRFLELRVELDVWCMCVSGMFWCVGMFE